MSEKARQQRYRRSVKGLLVVMYGGAVQKSKRRGHPEPAYTLEEFRDHYTDNHVFLKLYNAWVDSDYRTNLKPSIDRLDNTKPYTVENTQMVTWEVNLLNANQGTNVAINERPVDCYTKEGKFVCTYPSIVAAHLATQTNKSHITSVCKGATNRKTAGGYKWTYKDELLK